MDTSDRRTFLKLMGSPALAAALPLDLSRALAIPAHNRTGTIADVEHIVILMQENRSFDHYFGTMRGVRGFADPRAVKLPSGKSVWHQPHGSGDLLPFRPDVEDLGMTFLPDPPHGWNDTHAAWNGGQYDRWVPNKGVTTMTYHTRKDLPYQYALADAFTICDNYHCSLMGPTDPNRYHMWTGWVGNDGAGGGPVITNAEAGYDWSTYPERLERAGISWKIYQDVGVGLDAAGFWGWTDDPYIGNYGDNSLLYFHQYQFALPGTPLADRARTGTNILAQNREPDRLMDIFRDDVRHGRLPQVSWIVAPEAYCEHPNWEPDFGSWYVSQVIDILASNPDVWSKMALFITYDEEGGFFDHLVPPTPPQSRAQGRSTVETTNEIFPGDADHASRALRSGHARADARGLAVEQRRLGQLAAVRPHVADPLPRGALRRPHPDLIETNITPWRRAVAGDLTTAFDFKTPNASRRIDPAEHRCLQARGPGAASRRSARSARASRRCRSRSPACVRRARSRTRWTRTAPSSRRWLVLDPVPQYRSTRPPSFRSVRATAPMRREPTPSSRTSTSPTPGASPRSAPPTTISRCTVPTASTARSRAASPAGTERTSMSAPSTTSRAAASTLEISNRASQVARSASSTGTRPGARSWCSGPASPTRGAGR